ncbi:glycosyl hydrolase catalytic core-domain-containing protein [Xylariaceae sp. FL0804]|nr:glycosyl hydrolase catalytic core-domain-containing protein [Xylariaceae sp. FL0804]
MPSPRRALHVAALWALASSGRAMADSSSSSSKQGLAYVGDTHEADYELLLSSDSPISWYYNWSPYAASSDVFPSDARSRVEFVPALPAVDGLADSIAALDDSSSGATHLLTFNEPDGTTGSGGSSIDPDDAAKAYIEQVVPLRDRFNVSHPAVTGSSRGLQWLRDFNASCWAANATHGCPADFVVAHWYGDFAGLSAWLAELSGFYNASSSGLVSSSSDSSSDDDSLEMWVAELALPQEDETATLAMMNQSLPYLDALGYVTRYAWFGAFRPKEADGWTGKGVSLFENDGGLSDLGAYYLGGKANGFKAGEQGSGASGGNNGLGEISFAIWTAAALGCIWNLF